MIAASTVLFLAASTAQAGWLFVLAAGVLGLVGGSLLVPHRLAAVEPSRSSPARARVGDSVRVGLELVNGGRRALAPLRVEDAHPAFGPLVAASPRIPGGGTARLELVAETLRRGAFDGGRMTLRSGAPFGFFRAVRDVEVRTPIVVVPRWFEMRSFPILEPSSFPHDVLHERARTGAGEEYHSVREYRPGDPRRAVHWRTTARAGRLVVREFEQEVASRVVLVLAGRDAGLPPDSAFEALVSAAASIGIYALGTGHPVHVVRAAPDGPVRLAEPDRATLLEWLARADPTDAPLTPLVERALMGGPRRGTVVLLAPTAGEAGADLIRAAAAVQAAGARAIVVAARSSTWDGDDDDAALLEELGRGRATVKTVEAGEEIARCLE